jgi:hypothetical protein
MNYNREVTLKNKNKYTRTINDIGIFSENLQRK